MKEIELTKGFKTVVDDEDYEFLTQRKWFTKLNRDGKPGAVMRMQRYGPRSENKCKAVRMHRVIMNAPDNMVVDHINGNPLDNRKENLRICTRQQNTMNTRVRKSETKTSKYKGVCWDNSRLRYLSVISYMGKSYKLGQFKNEKEAALAYNRKALELHGEFARLNVIEEG